MHWESSVYIFDNHARIWKRPGAAAFAYSDGAENESDLLELLRSVTDLSVHSDELRVLQTDWITTYYLSSARSNLLRPLASTLLENADVLELGCGCGAVTRYLGETARNVFAVEGSERRASIAAARCRDLDNVCVIADSIADLSDDIGRFDVVTLIGVLEYARIFGGNPGAELELLRKAKYFLKPGGVLVLAIENKLGLKYLAGVPEEHLGSSWTGVMGAYEENGVTTWSRLELTNLLKDAGFDGVQQYIPVPDYKLPSSVITPEGLAAPDSEFRKSPILSLRTRSFEQCPLFNTQQTWENVCDAGLLADLADSLCFTAVNESAARKLSVWHEDILLAHYGGALLPKRYAKEMQIIRKESGLVVNRRHLFPGLQDVRAMYRQQLENEIYINEELLFSRCRKVLLRRGWCCADLADALRPWSDWLLSQIEDGTVMVPASAIDVTPFNMLVDDAGKLTIFDREWISEEQLPVTTVFLRCFLEIFSLFGVVAEPHEGTPLSIEPLAQEMIVLLRMPPENRALAEVFEDALSFSNSILLGNCSREQIMGLRLQTIVLNPEKTFEQQRNIFRLKEEVQQAHNEIAVMLSSRSWRITRLLRDGVSFIRRTPGLRFLAVFYRMLKKAARLVSVYAARLASVYTAWFASVYTAWFASVYTARFASCVHTVRLLIPLLPDYFLIKKNPLFDSSFYLENTPEAISSPFPPALHYLYAKGDRPANPSADFNAEKYWSDYPDAQLSGKKPLVHYLRYGKKAGLTVSPLYVKETQPVPAPSWDAWEQCAGKVRGMQAADAADPCIVIPVYRGFDETLNCLYSVLKSSIETGSQYRLLVVDDHSPEPELSQALERLKAMGLIELIKNEKNLGFVLSVNRGVLKYPKNDVILLNSDTEVYGNWVERLSKCAYQSYDIGTVTPFSNNATLCSYPLFFKNFPYSFGVRFAELDRVVSKANAGQFIDIPTGVGFCMYIKRDCLDAVGLFDYETFGKGYGEECDFCRRALNKGWRSVLCVDAFVRHLGRISFGGEMRAKVEHANSLLRRRHPEYEPEVMAFRQTDPVRLFREKVDMELVRYMFGEHMRILYITHSWGGGTFQHVDDLCRAVIKQGATVGIGIPGAKRTLLGFNFPQLNWQSNVRDIELDSSPVEAGKTFQNLGFQHIHVHHTIGFNYSFPYFISAAAKSANITYDFTVHDYYCICPRIHMVDASGFYCHCFDLLKCDVCLKKLGCADVAVGSIENWRAMYGRFLRAARMVFVPNEDVAGRLASYYPDVSFTVRKHMECFLPKRQEFIAQKKGEVLRVAVLGRVGEAKGSDVLKSCAAEAEKHGLPIQFCAIGTGLHTQQFKKFRNIKVCGEYSRAGLGEKLRVERCHLAFFPAVCPETYSYSLSEAFAAGLYPVCFDLGALALRIREMSWGSIIPMSYRTDPKRIIEFLLSCRTSPPPENITESIGGVYPDIFKDYYLFNDRGEHGSHV